MSKLDDFCKKEVFVLDTETTGLTGAPFDKVVDIAICKVDLDDGIVTEVYSSVVGHDVSLWNDTLRNAWIFENTDMTLEMVSEAPSEETVIKEVTEILRGSNVTSFNRAFDFDKFLFKEPWSLRGKFIPVRCIMLASVNVCKLPGEFEEYKWPKLGEAYDIIVKDDPAGLNGIQSHRALSDALAASYILLELYRSGNY
jgi:DNA polymerase-3 subunit epsilon